MARNDITLQLLTKINASTEDIKSDLGILKESNRLFKTIFQEIENKYESLYSTMHSIYEGINTKKTRAREKSIDVFNILDTKLSVKSVADLGELSLYLGKHGVSSLVKRPCFPGRVSTNATEPRESVLGFRGKTILFSVVSVQ